MAMNKTNFKQYDTRWAKLGYPKSPYFIKDCGCGEVSIANCIIEMEKYANQTPKTIQPYCVQFAAPNGNGTYFSGIPTMMKHYGMTEVKEHGTLDSLWKELEKGNRVAIYLMGSRKGGSKAVHWTSSAHFVCSVAYKVENGKHYVYVKDSNSTSSLRNGWISYEDNMRGDVSRVWSGRLYMEPKYYPTTPYSGTLPTASVKKGSTGANVKALQSFLNWCINAKLAVDGDFGSNTDTAVRKWQTQYSKEYGIAVDGVFGAKSIKVAKEIVAKYAPKEDLQPWYDVLKEQYEWMKDSVYKWVNPPTIANSKTKSTCIALPSCALQRLGLFESGQWIYLDLKTCKINGNAADFVKSHPELFEVLYPNKTIDALGDNIHKGDIIAFTGTRGHIMVYMGKDANGNPVFDTMGNKKNHPIGVCVKVPQYASKKINMLVRLKKVTK